MAGVKALILLALSASIGLLFLVLGCALPSYNNWWPLFVIIFYVLSPIPTVIARRFQADDMASSSALTELAYFLTTGIVISAFGLPIVLAHANHVIDWGSCGFVLAGNAVCFSTILAYFVVHRDDESISYGGFF